MLVSDELIVAAGMSSRTPDDAMGASSHSRSHTSLTRAIRSLPTATLIRFARTFVTGSRIWVNCSLSSMPD